ncbi:Coiled-coil domain-containing protein 97 [Chytridiales sp. JEL 0842]|nr:Coiled-coil domain-containing protein 97 [Chytridiales sp. JEL 0842]
MTPIEDQLVQKVTEQVAQYGQAQVDEDTIRAMLNESPAEFLNRWGCFLTEDQLHYFEHINDQPDLRYELYALRQRSNYRAGKSRSSTANDAQSSKATIRNRRLAYLEKNPKEMEEYFSDNNIKRRNPELYELYIGRYVPEEERKKPFAASLSLSDRMFHNIDEQQYLEKLGISEPTQDQIEEVESGDDSDLEDLTLRKKVLIFHSKTADEREEMRLELLRTLKEGFLNGDDEEFDYSLIDSNADLEMSNQAQQDNEDSYFDE